MELLYCQTPKDFAYGQLTKSKTIELTRNPSCWKHKKEYSMRNNISNLITRVLFDD